jgi:hypothetical protein
VSRSRQASNFCCSSCLSIEAPIATICRYVAWLAVHTGPLNWLCSEKGRYLLLPMDEAPELTEEQEDGLEAALASVRAGKDMSLEEVREAQTPRRAMPLLVAPEALDNLGRESTARVDSVDR